VNTATLLDGPTRSASMRRWGRHIGAAMVIAIAASLTPLLPWSTRANNTAALNESKTRLAVVEHNIEQLNNQKTALLSDAEVRRLAREEFGLAPTGADVYSLPGLHPGLSSGSCDTEIAPGAAPHRSHHRCPRLLGLTATSEVLTEPPVVPARCR
jgi:hypothetical protein